MTDGDRPFHSAPARERALFSACLVQVGCVVDEEAVVVVGNGGRESRYNGKARDPGSDKIKLALIFL